MNIRSFDEILERFPAKRILSSYAVDKLPSNIAGFMQRLAGNELSCDCRFENDDGGYLYSEREDADNFALIATSGQGDEWLLRLSDGEICFLDHGDWEKPEALFSIMVTFEQFVSMADLLGQFESETSTEDKLETLKRQLDLIHPMLLEHYPFGLE